MSLFPAILPSLSIPSILTALLAAFSSYGGFWLSYATIFIPGSGIVAAYTDEAEFGHAVGFYLAVWFIFTFILL